MIGRLTRLLLYNSAVFFCFIILLDLVLGDWKEFKNDQKNNALVPGLIKNRTEKYDAKLLYDSRQEVPITYSRDENGYRSKEINSQKKIILTIGGSTTDQRYVTEGETWQDYLDNALPKFDFVNGGIDGQSTYGHIAAIKSWHSSALKSNSVDTIIFYVGINDLRLLNATLNEYDKDQSFFTGIRSSIKQYSFIYPRLRKIYKSISMKFDSNGGEIIIASHGRSDREFKNEQDGIIFSEKYKESYNFYKILFTELINQTKKYFPKSKIIIIQQQIPGCKFKSKYAGIDIHLHKSIQDVFCNQLASVYATQDQAIKSFIKTNEVKILPMYLKNIIGSNDVYDNVHTNQNGSKKIGMYILKSGVIPN